MNILFLTPYLPYPLNNGGLIRVHHLLVNLATKHQVTMLCMEPDNEPQSQGIEVIKGKGVEIELIPVASNQKKERKRLYQLLSLFSSKPYQYQQYYSNAMQAAIDKHLATGKYDLVLTEFSQMGYYDLKTDIPKYVDQHNVEYEIMLRTYETEKNPLRRLLAYSEWKKYNVQEIENCKKFTACLTTSQRDADILQERIPDMPCHVIPNGVDSDYFKATDKSSAATDANSDDPNMVLFTGTISYYPNTEGIMWFHTNIWPLIKQKKPDATFCIAGKGPPAEVLKLAEEDSSIIVTGMVDDMRDYYNMAAAVVVPLRVGGGTRLKILEGMSMSKAIVSTTVGAEGIDHSDGKDIILQDDPQAFCDAVVSLMNDAALRASVGSAGRQLVEDKYDWRAISNTLSDIFG